MATATDSNKQKMVFNEEQQLHKEAETMRLIAFFSIFVAAIACLVGIVAVPMLYGYLQRVQSVLEVEADYCKSATGTLWQQFARTQIIKGVAPSLSSLSSSASLEEATKRGKRQTGYGGDAAASGAKSSAAPSASPNVTGGVVSSAPLHVADKPKNQPTCGCSCGIGMAGPPGEPGPDGEPGKDGQAGPAGHNGADVAPNEHPKPKEFCFECEPSAPGPAGDAGPKGSPGSPGPNGQPGAPGKSSGPGEPGPPGPPGQAGAPGSNGQPGAAGQVKQVDVPAGPPGPPGQPGQNGTPGTPGQAGKPGSDGAPGPAGDDGQPGKPGKAGENGDQGPAGVKGNEGACDHCPTPRSAPGY